MLKDGGRVRNVVASIPYTATIVLIVAENARRSIKMERMLESIDRQFERLYEENRLLRQCLMHALSYRPLPSDPLQLFVKERCPDVIEQWEKMRKVNE